MTDTETQVQPGEGQGQPTTPPVAAPPVAAPPAANPGPWAADLAASFTDATVRASVDQFLRDRVQPYTTQLEQRAAVAQDAQRLWDALAADPQGTYQAITAEMYGAEVAAQIQTTLDGQHAAATAAAAAAGEPAPVDPRVQAAIDYIENKQNAEIYDAELLKLVTAHPDVDTEIIHDYIALAEGDFEKAYQMYAYRVGQFNAKVGNGAPVVPPADPALPPPVMGADGATGATPVTPRRQSLDEAINDFMGEQRAARVAPPVAG